MTARTERIRDKFKERARGWWYRKRKSLLTKQERCLPFESGDNVLPGMEYLSKHPLVEATRNKTKRSII